jgi:tetratricopeptide (TPR) repeat protein
MIALPALVVAAGIAAPCTAPCAVEITATQIFDEADRLAIAKDFDQAVALLKIVTHDRNPDFRAEARVRIARYLTAAGDSYGAAYWYQQLLDEKPDAAAVRIELARLLAAMGEESSAARELRRAEAIGLPPEVSRAIRDATEAFRSNQPIGFNASIGIAPDTNVNSATSSDTINIFGLPFQLGDDGKAKSGVGLTFESNLIIRRPTNRLGRLITEISASGRLYRDNRFNDTTFAVRTGPELRVTTAIAFRPALTVGRRIYGTETLYDFFGVSGVEQFRADSKAQVTINQAVSRFSYSPMRKGQSGTAYTLGAAYDRALSGRFATRIGLTWNRANAADRQYATESVTGDVTLSRDFGHWTLYARGASTWLKGDAEFSLFGTPRDDHVEEADAGLLFRRISLFGLSPQIRLTYIHATSPVPLFRYNRLRSEFSLAKNF